MSFPSSDHKNLIQQEFTQQAQAYAANPVVKDQARLNRLVQAVHPQPQAHVLDIATGPGYVAAAFAETGCEVIGLDLTDAPLAIAERMRQERGLTNLRFQRGDAENLPFGEQTFDIVICRLALHHFEAPQHVLAEMARVCRSDGQVVVEDLVASEHPARAVYYNTIEQLRDPSHTRALPVSEFLAYFTACHLEVEQIYTQYHPQAVEQWLTNTQTPVARAERVRAMLEQDELHDLSGITPFRQEEALYFRHRHATFITRKLATPPAEYT